MAVLAALVVLVRVPNIPLTAAACEAPPVRPVPVGADHVYVVPAGMIPFAGSTGVTAKLTPLQVVVLIGAMVAVGSIVTVTVNTIPVQLPDTGVTV